MSNLRYKGPTIVLIPSMEGLMWACQYVIMKANQTEIAGFPRWEHLRRSRKSGTRRSCKSKIFN